MDVFKVVQPILLHQRPICSLFQLACVKLEGLLLQIMHSRRTVHSFHASLVCFAVVLLNYYTSVLLTGLYKQCHKSLEAHERMRSTSFPHAGGEKVEVCMPHAWFFFHVKVHFSAGKCTHTCMYPGSRCSRGSGTEKFQHSFSHLFHFIAELLNNKKESITIHQSRAVSSEEHQMFYGGCRGTKPNFPRLSSPPRRGD